MSKPQEILDIEKEYGVLFTHVDKKFDLINFFGNNFWLDDSENLVGLKTTFNFESDFLLKLPYQMEILSIDIGKNLSLDFSVLSNLKELTISGRQIPDNFFLSSSTSLEHLSLIVFQLLDISFLSSLTSLRYLDLGFNKVSDISVLSSLTSLKHLSLNGSQISDISVLSSLTSLKHLSLSGSQISDISILSSLTSLRYLDLGFTKVSDISKLSYLTSLEVLNLSGTQVSDISVLSSLASLKSLYFSCTKVSDISKLSYLTSLEVLNLSGTQVSDISILSSLTSLKLLDLSSTKVLDITVLSSLSSLESLKLSFTKVSDISILSSLTSLKLLNMISTKVLNITVLSSLSSLEFLYLSPTKVSDLSSLSSLESWDLSSTEVSGISVLPSLTSLKELSLPYLSISNSLSKLKADKTHTTILDKSISGLEELLLNLKNLKSIHLEGTDLPLPTDCLRDLSKLKAYIADAKKGTTTKRNIKLLFIGDGCVGKSTLLSHLQYLEPPKPIDKNARTEGIQLDIWQDYFSDYTINVWDFGGQEILHSTHQLFLGERAIYILVGCHESAKLCTQDEIHPITYWLDFIADFGKKSIVLFVENMIDGHPSSNEFPVGEVLEELIDTYAQRDLTLIPTHNKLDCQHQTREVKVLKDNIKHRIEQLQEQYPIESYPENWYAFQKRLEEERVSHKTISKERYLELAAPYDLSDPLLLLEHFNDTGVLSYFRNLNDLIVLQSSWILDAIYAALKLKDNPLTITKGKLSDVHFNLIWNDYSDTEKRLFKDYMIKSNLLAEVPEGKTYQYLIPALFEQQEERDRFEWESKESYVVLKFKFIFVAIMQQLQVRILNHCDTDSRETFFRNYISFTDRHKNHGYVEVLDTEKEMRIYSKSVDLVQVLLNEVNDIYPLDRLEVLERKGEEEIPFTWKKDNDKRFDTPIEKSSEFDSDNHINMEKEQENSTDRCENKVFVTYSWSDENGNFDEAHQNRVGKLVTDLRGQWGLDATFDLYEEERNFVRMMFKNLKQADKVIIVLSKGYTVKADDFKISGVATEYEAIISDIKKNPNKYILVAFDKYDSEKVPYGLQENKIFVLKDTLKPENRPWVQESLLLTLTDQPLVKMAERAKITPKATPKSF